jgi:hypothetical protein
MVKTGNVRGSRVLEEAERQALTDYIRKYVTENFPDLPDAYNRALPPIPGKRGEFWDFLKEEASTLPAPGTQPTPAQPAGEASKAVAATRTPAAPPTQPRQSSAAPASAPSVEEPPHPMQTRTLELVERLTKEGPPIIANLGGAGAPHEPANAINVNNQAVGRKGIPNLVEADGSDIGMLFKPATLDRIEGHNMAPEAIDWSRAAPGAYKTLKSGGTLYYYYRGFSSDAQFAGEQLRKAGFKDVQVIENVIIQATKP